jgi:hypothetical protein
MGCFIRTAGHPAARPYLIIWLLVMLAIGVVVQCRRQASGIRRQGKKQGA